MSIPRYNKGLSDKYGICIQYNNSSFLKTVLKRIKTKNRLIAIYRCWTHSQKSLTSISSDGLKKYEL